MKTPESPPAMNLLLEEARAKGRVERVLQAINELEPSRRYRHWDKLRHRKPPNDLVHREWWLALKLARLPYRQIALRSIDGRAFQYTLVDPISEFLHEIDSRTRGSIGMPDPITNPETKARYIVNSLVEEAITSSQLEGAATTRRVAKEMIRTGRPPRDHGEQMILNNYSAMQMIVMLRDKLLTPETILNLHRIVTQSAIDDPADAGRLRRPDQRIEVADLYNRVFHVPPPADRLESRMAEMCDFANGKIPKTFVHPVLRSIILHFWLAYDHPFVDGNGRTARALFYWSMLHQGYWLCEFISISEIIRKAPAQYGRAFLYTETDDNDLTYFMLYHLEVIRKAIEQLHSYVERKTVELREAELRMRAVADLNHRQCALISHALRHPGYRYTFDSHSRSHNVVYQTARTDLLELAKRGFLEARKVGREWQFVPAIELDELLRKPSV